MGGRKLIVVIGPEIQTIDGKYFYHTLVAILTE
jgi:hypothetical protein